MLEILEEVTDWDTPNHIYVLEKKSGKCIGYFPKKGFDYVRFSAPRAFSKRFRKFKNAERDLGLGFD